MRYNQIVSAHRVRTLNTLLLFLAAAGIITVTCFGFRSRGSQGASTSQGTSTMNISVQDPRPLAKTIEILEARCGCVITYEDPRYVHESETSDVTAEVRRDFDPSRPDEGPRILIPREGSLTVNYDVQPATNKPVDPSSVVQQLLDAHAMSDNAGRFRMEKSGQIIHVIPTAVKNSAGDLAPQESLLDARITLPAEERDGEQTLKAIRDAIERATHTRVLLGAYPWKLLRRYKSQQGAENQKARDVQANFLEGVKVSGANLSWQLFYDPGLKWYALNIHLVPMGAN